MRGADASFRMEGQKQTACCAAVYHGWHFRNPSRREIEVRFESATVDAELGKKFLIEVSNTLDEMRAQVLEDFHTLSQG
jgi:hypothetical protein